MHPRLNVDRLLIPESREPLSDPEHDPLLAFVVEERAAFADRADHAVVLVRTAPSKSAPIEARPTPSTRIARLFRAPRWRVPVPDHMTEALRGRVPRGGIHSRRAAPHETLCRARRARQWRAWWTAVVEGARRLNHRAAIISDTWHTWQMSRIVPRLVGIWLTGASALSLFAVVVFQEPFRSHVARSTPAAPLPPSAPNAASLALAPPTRPPREAEAASLVVVPAVAVARMTRPDTPPAGVHTRREQRQRKSELSTSMPTPVSQFRGSLAVSSSPSGGRVFVNGVSVGSHTACATRRGRGISRRTCRVGRPHTMVVCSTHRGEPADLCGRAASAFDRTLILARWMAPGRVVHVPLLALIPSRLHNTRSGNTSTDTRAETSCRWRKP
jgi:hypothetical protein